MSELSSDVLAFRAGALSLQRSFATLAPIIRRTYLLSANAEVTSAHLGGAGASFSIIARELVYVVRELAKLIDELDLLFRQVARASAGWLRAERRANILRDALGRLEGRGAAGAGLPAVQDAAAAPVQRSSAEHLSQALGQSHAQIVRDLGSIIAQMRRTTRFVNRLSWVAVRQCHFVAVTARIEAARSEHAGQDIASVAGEIRRLADDVAAAEQKARDGVLAVMGHIAFVSDIYGAGVTQAVAAGSAA